METIDDARICVNTGRRIAQKLLRGKWFPLSDYSDRNELLTACHAYYKRENTPELHFTAWENIPEELITPKSISENFFLLREAMETLDENEYTHFLRWCCARNYRLAEEEPYHLVSRYKEDVPGLQSEDELPFTGQYVYDLPAFPDEEEDYHPSHYGIHRLYTGQSNNMYH
nr:hypothetical protein [Bacteroides intestinalis]